MSGTLRIGLTGATGVLGRSVQQWWQGVEWIPFRGDVRELADLQDWAHGAGALDAVLHFAAIVPLLEVERDPLRAFEVNVRGTWNLMDAFRERQPWMFLASSSHVYATESSLYGVTKLLAEQAGIHYGRAAGMRVCAGRIFSFSAAAQAEPYLLPTLVRRIRTAEPHGRLELRGGNNVRDFLTTRRIASAIETLFAHRSTGVCDIGSGSGVTVLELARKLAARLDRPDLDLVSADEESTVLVADITRLRDLGWQPGEPLEELLAELAQGARP
jgi:nucleoside-diphosphate-sugar epimerase